jgi:Zn-dependent protease
MESSWLLLGMLIAWSLSQGLFPHLIPDLDRGQYWSMGLAGVFGLLGSIVLHEASHALVARRFGMPIDGITLFIFGGIAEMEDEPPSARAEFLMAAAGPALSALLAALFAQLVQLNGAVGLPATVGGVLLYLFYLNLLLALFNILPAFPMDGGRMLRAGLWAWRGDLLWATSVASRLGNGFGWAMVAFGAFLALSGNLLGGIWWTLIGLFMRVAAKGTYRQLLVREQLGNTPVRSMMDPDPPAVPAVASVEEVLLRHAPRSGWELLPVVEGSHLVGCVRPELLRALPRADWSRTPVGPLAGVCPVEQTIAPDARAFHALHTMLRAGAPRLMVVERGDLRGVLTLRELARLGGAQRWQA